MFVVRLAVSACQAAQLAHTRDGHARVVRKVRDEFAPDA